MNGVGEEFHVVDDSDDIIGSATREKLHSGGKLIHRAVHILVIDDKDRILVSKRSKNKDLYKGLYNSSASGHVDLGESYLEAAERELSEELPNVKGKLEYMSNLLVETVSEREYSTIYICWYQGQVEFNEDEVESVEFMSQEKIKELNKKGFISPVFNQILNEYNKQSQKQV